MGSTVKIPKRKNLRYKLVSVLFLLFISMAITQIPIDWMRVNPIIFSDLDNNLLELDNSDKDIHDLIQEVDSMYHTFLTDGNIVLDEGYKGHGDYAFTNRFFYLGNGAERFFSMLTVFRDKLISSGDDEKLNYFDEVFEDDIANGLKDKNFDEWKRWRFKDVPHSVTALICMDYKVSLSLFFNNVGAYDSSDGILADDPKDESTEDESVEDRLKLKIAFNLESLKLGDTARFIFEPGISKQVIISLKGQRVTDELIFLGDTVAFIPTKTGIYRMLINSNGKSDVLSIAVRPRKLEPKDITALHHIYIGKKTTLEYASLARVWSLRSPCLDYNNVELGDNSITFTPQQQGWCSLKFLNKQGDLVLFDSVYVQPVPVPFLIAEGVSDFKISRNRLMELNELTIRALRPAIEGLDFNISSMTVEFFGSRNNKKTVNSGTIDFTSDELKWVQHLRVSEVVVNHASGSISINEPLLIEIL